MKIPLLILLLSLSIGCATRIAHPVSISNANDQNLTCAEIIDQIKANEDKANILVGEENSTDAQNAAAFAGGLLAWPLLLAMDLSDVEKIEINALHDRSQILADLKESKGC